MLTFGSYSVRPLAHNSGLMTVAFFKAYSIKHYVKTRDETTTPELA